MDPLVELTESAKARIKAREAEAEEKFNEVVRACEGDLATAQRLGGGYFDLHQDELRDAVERARACTGEAELLSAQYVFMAHATEYRQFLPDPSELKPVLASLRDLVIKNYGEQVRYAIQLKEAEQMEKARRDWNTKPEVEVEYEAPILVGDAPFWRARRNDFREYNTGENNSLLADWDSPTDSWSFRGSTEAQAVFEPLATIASKGLQAYDQDEPWRSWLDELRRRRCNYRESPTTAAYSQRAMEDPSKFGFEPPKVKGELRTGTVDQKEMTDLFGPEIAERKRGPFVQTRFSGVHGILERLFEASIKLCLEFEAKATGHIGQPGERDDRARKAPAPLRKGRAPTDQQTAAAEAIIENKAEVSIQHAAWYLRCSVAHVRRLIREEKLTASKTRPKRVTTESLRIYKWPSKGGPPAPGGS